MIPYGLFGRGATSSDVGYCSASPYTDEELAQTTFTSAATAASKTRCVASTLRRR